MTLNDTLASLRALAAERRADVWAKGKPRQRAADKRRRLAKAEAIYQAMPKLRQVEGSGDASGPTGSCPGETDARGAANSTKPGEWTPNPPGEKLGGKPSRKPKPVGLPPFINTRPATPAPGREPFDTLFTDVRHLRGDLRMVRTAIREDRVPFEIRALLVDKLCALLDSHDARVAAKGGFRAARILIAAAWCLVDGVGMDQREEFREYRRQANSGARGPIRRSK